MAHALKLDENAIRNFMTLEPRFRQTEAELDASVEAGVEICRWFETAPDKELFQKHLRTLDPAAQSMTNFVLGFGLFLIFLDKLAKEMPPSKGYYKLLNVDSSSPCAKHFSRLTFRGAQDEAAIDQLLGDVVRAIRFLGGNRRQKSRALLKIGFLLEKANETSVLDRICADATEQIHFVKLLKEAVDVGQTADLIAKCLELTKRVKLRRGPKISAASAGHQSLVEIGLIGSRSYTYCDADADYTDPLTVATRLEFDKPKFHPRPSVKRAKRTAKS